MKPIKKLQMGKHKLTPEFIEQARKMFEDSEIVKITILKSACRDKAEAKKLADELMASLGNKFAYRLVGYVMTVRKFRKLQR